MSDIWEKIVAATVGGDERQAAELAREAVAAGIDPLRLLQEGYGRGMHIIGERFARLDCFLPEVILAADAMNAAVAVLKPHLMQRAETVSRGTVVIATIQGDLHDLGKNIVKIMLQVEGFDVHDLGADVPVADLIDKAESVGADIIAASAILTTTMAHMPDIARHLQELGLRDKYMIMMGGAPVIADWALANGADGYGEDAAEAVAVAKELIRKKKGGTRS